MLGIKESKAAKIARAVILALFFLWSLIPVYIVITNAIKPTLDITAIPPKLFFQPTLSHFQKAFSNGDFLLYFKNSIIITSVTTLICVLFGAMGAYGLLIMKSRAGKQASSFLLIGKLVPSITILIPFYSILVKLGLHRTYIGVILAHCSLNLPFIVGLLFCVQLFKNIVDPLHKGRVGRIERNTDLIIEPKFLFAGTEFDFFHVNFSFLCFLRDLFARDPLCPVFHDDRIAVFRAVCRCHAGIQCFHKIEPQRRVIC